MTTQGRYPSPLDDTVWKVPGTFDTVFRWEYEEGRDALGDDLGLPRTRCGDDLDVSAPMRDRLRG